MTTIDAAKQIEELHETGKIEGAGEEGYTPTIAVTSPSDELLTRKDFEYGCIFGPAGSGKTFLVRKAMETRPGWGLLCATTGAAARVLGPNIRTIHSTVGVFDAKTIRRSYDKGDLTNVLTHIRKHYERIVIDEVSMLGREFFEILVAACKHVGIGLILVGDFLQLPPVPNDKETPQWNQRAPWLFQSPAFQEFRENTWTLNTQYRFENVDYVTGINFLRAGKAEAAIPYLKTAGVTFLPKGTPLDDFDGTVIVATKSQRDVINNQRYRRLKVSKKKIRSYKTIRNGQQLAEWSEIPANVSLKIGARVMILRNLYDKNEDKSQRKLLQANGEMGVVTKLLEDFVVVTRDDGTVVDVEMMTVHNGQQHAGHDGVMYTQVKDTETTGTIQYMPLALAWSMNVHKMQGITLKHKTRVVMEDFFEKPAMVYVACSRVADPRDLVIVGGGTLATMYGMNEPVQIYDKPRLVELCNTDPNCGEYL